MKTVMLQKISSWPGAGFLLAGLCLLWGTAVPAADGLPAAATLDHYLDRAQTHNPQLRQSAHQVQALQEQARGAGSLPDLQLGYREMLVPVETRVGPQQRAFSVSQGIPWFGTLGLQREVADLQAAAAAERHREKVLAVQRQVRDAWYGLAETQGEIAIIRTHLALARQVEAASRAAYEAGRESYASLLKAQMDLGRLETRLATLQDGLTPLTARLNRLSGWEATRPAPAADLMAVTLPANLLEDRDGLVERMLRWHPGLAARNRQIALARSGRRLADKQGAPSLSLGLDYIMTGEATNPTVDDSGKDPVIARVGLSLPLWGGQAGARKAAAAEEILAAEGGRDGLALDLENRLDDAHLRWRTAERNRRLYGETLAGRAGQDLEVTTAAYQAGSLDFDDLLSSRQNLLGIQLAALQAEADRCRALNEIFTLLGGPRALAEGTAVDAAVQEENR